MASPFFSYPFTGIRGINHKERKEHYLKATGIGHGLLMNPGSNEFEIQELFTWEEPRINTARRLPVCVQTHRHATKED